MPKSKQRKHHHDYRPPANAVKAKKNKSAVLVATIFCSLLGIGIAYFATGSTALWLICGGLLGGLGGYYFGRQIDRSFAKK